MKLKLTNDQFNYRKQLLKPSILRIVSKEKVWFEKEKRPTLRKRELDLEFKEYKKTKIYDALFIALAVFHSVPKKVAESIIKRAFVNGFSTGYYTDVFTNQDQRKVN